MPTLDKSQDTKQPTPYLYIIYSYNPLFGYADETTLQFAGYWQNSDGWTNYERDEAEPSF